MLKKNYPRLISSWIYLAGLTLAGCTIGSSMQPPPQGPTITSVSISPTAVTLQVSQQQQFSATVSGTGNFDSSVQWFVNDVAGGDNAVGTVAAGLYTAPTQVPSPAEVIIKAVATADSTKSARAQATTPGDPYLQFRL
jgi:hypothetical protein